MRQKLLLLIFLLTTLISSISAQTNNPANIILTGTGRYSLKLSDYATSSPSMLTMTVSVSDATISNMPVKFMEGEKASEQLHL